MLGRLLRVATVKRSQPVRHGGHWLHKNIRAEENAGLREASYKTWEFDMTSIPRITLYLIVPGLLFYVLAVDENKAKDAQIGKKHAGYGVMPPGK
jgi:hypothetical protein